MLSKKLSNRIREAAEEMTADDLLEFLQELERKGKLEIDYDGWDYAIEFAKHLVGKMSEALEQGNWWGYEIKALKCLDDIPCREEDIIEINNYGFPVEIEDNDRFLEVLGIADQMEENDNE